MYVQGIIKMVWYDYICFKPSTVTEFLVAEKSIMNIHKQLKNVYSIRAVERSIVTHWPVNNSTQILLQSAEELI